VIDDFPMSSFGGVEELWFETADDLLTALRDESYERVVERGLERFADLSSRILVAAEEALQFDRGFGAVKFIGLSKRTARFSHDGWIRYWQDAHGPLAHGIPEFTRYYGLYVQLRARPPIPRAGDGR
jgi:hypothetical protein